MPTLPSASDSRSKKATKLRATCDACKDAKVRCNRDVPTCYRCRNQKLNCVYNLSRRMGRPRRNRCDAGSVGAGAEDERHNTQGRSHCDTDGRRDETTLRGVSSGKQAHEHGNRPGTLKTIDSTDHNGNCAGLSSNCARTQNSISGMSSLMDPFGSPRGYDLNQIQTSTIMSDIDQMVDFDFLDDPSSSITPDSAVPNSSRTSHWMRPQAESTLDGVSIQEHSRDNRPMATSLSDPGAETLTNGNMTLIDGFEEGSFSILEATIDLEPTHARDNSRQRTTSAVGKHDENRVAPSQSATCECYQIILQKLSDIDENQSDIFSSTIDVALMLEQCVQGHITKILECGICTIKRPTILLLLAIITDNVVCTLEASSRFDNSRSPVDTSNCSHSSNAQNPPSFRTPQVADMTGEGKSTASPVTKMAADKPPLFVGSHEILTEEKNKFLKQLLQRRLSSFSATLRQLMQRNSSQNLNSKYGATMMAETYKRLQSVIGRLELWDG